VASLQKKENAGTARREMGFKVTPRRNVLSAINNGGANGGAPSAPADGGGGGGGGGAEAAPVVEFSGREDVERLLAEKMKGKSKNDYKVGSERGFYWCVLASDLEAFS
jgi:kinesin family protein C1